MLEVMHAQLAHLEFGEHVMVRLQNGYHGGPHSKRPLNSGLQSTSILVSVMGTLELAVQVSLRTSGGFTDLFLYFKVKES